MTNIYVVLTKNVEGIEKELSSEKINIEKQAYIKELTEGKYRDTKKLVRSLKQRKIDMNKF